LSKRMQQHDATMVDGDDTMVRWRW